MQYIKANLIQIIFMLIALDYSVALFIVLAFVPIIILSKRFFPIMLGSRAHKENNKIIFE